MKVKNPNSPWRNGYIISDPSTLLGKIKRLNEKEPELSKAQIAQRLKCGYSTVCHVLRGDYNQYTPEVDR